MRCNFCGAEWNLPYKMTITECPFCRRPLATPGAGTRSSGYTPQPSGTANKREDFDIVGTVLRAYKGTNPVVYVPEGITELGMIKPNTGAFFENKVIQKVVLPKSLRKMSTKAFASSSVREVVFSDGITYIPKQAFENCSNLFHVTLSSTITDIRDHAFYHCSKLQTINLPEGLNSIGESAFHKCFALYKINLPIGLSSIGSSAFQDCSALRQINLPTTLTQIGAHAFEHTGLESIVVPGSVTKIPPRCFACCTNLKSVNLRNGIKIIGSFSFHSCNALTEVILPDGTETLEHGVFKDCYYLTHVTIPNSVVQIAEYKYWSRCSVDYGIFENCTALIDVTWPSTRFNTSIFMHSLFYDKIIDEQKALAEKQKAAEEKKKRDATMIGNGKCPKCNGDLSFWTNRCKKCGTKY